MHVPFVLLFIVALSVNAMPGAEIPLRLGAGFSTVEDGAVLGHGQDGRFESGDPIAPGVWQVQGEYRTEGFAATGMIALDVLAANRRATLSAYSSTPAASDWTPFALSFRVEQAEAVALRFGNWRGADGKARLLVRNARIVPFRFEAGNWLVNGDWRSGRRGEMPAMWEWRSQAPDPGSIALVENTSFKSGNQVLRLTGGAQSRILNYTTFPMPPRGEIEFSAWARTLGGKHDLNLWLYGAGWKPRIGCGGKVGEEWRRCSGILAVDDNSPKTFSLGIHLPEGDGVVELADLRVVWHPEGRRDAGGQEDRLRGWPGVPGRNLVANPDFELDGANWSYDTSWAKSTADFRSIAAVTAAEIRAGAGVAGGHAAVFTGPGTIRSDMFPVTLGSTYSVSMYLRAPPGAASGDCLIAIFDTEWQAALYVRVKNVPADDWRRYEWTFPWKKANRQGKANVRFTTETGVQIDRVQVEEGTTTPYESPVMLGLLRDGRPYIVRGRDSPACVVRVVPGSAGGGPLDISVIARDAWGVEAWRLERTLAGTATEDLPFTIPTGRLGHFHVALNATSGGRTVGIGTSHYAVIDPPRLEDVPAGRFGLFGVCHELFNYPAWLNRDVGAVLRDLGIRTTRFFARTPADLPDPLPDELASGLRASCKAMGDAGIAVLPCVDLMPPVMNADKSLAMPTADELAAYGAALQRYVRSLQPEVRAVEIFNEPNLRRITSGPDAGKPTLYPAKYVAFQQAAFEAIRAVDPGILVVSCALNGTRGDWLDQWARLGGGRWMDVLSYHAYGSWGEGIPAEAERVRTIFAGAGFTGPIIDSEMYFAWRDFAQRTSSEEYFRGYFRDRELDAAGKTIQFYIGHAAADLPYCAFAPFITIMRHGPGQAMQTWDLFPAINATTRFLIGAGRGEVLQTGLPYQAILFPKAPEGPLLAVWAASEVEGSLALPGPFEAFDMMGNPYAAERRAAGVRLASDPTWLRFPVGTDAAAIRDALAIAKALGLGPPVALSISLGGPDSVAATVTSRSNRPIDGRIRLVAKPDGWTPAGGDIPFTGLEPGRSRTIAIPFTSMVAVDLGRYPLAVTVECGEDFARAQTVVRPLFVPRLARVVADGEVAEWPAGAWIPLGETHLSRVFNPDLPQLGADDLSARIACAWTPEGLAVAAVVRDDVHAPAAAEQLGWQGDALQLYIDQRKDASRTAPNVADDVGYTIGLMGGRPTAWLDKGSDGNFKGEANRLDGFVDADPRIAVVRTDGGTVYEILLPWSSCLPQVRTTAGAVFGFSLLINDNDGKGRKTGLTLATPGGEPYGAPWDWLDAVLLP